MKLHKYPKIKALLPPSTLCFSDRHREREGGRGEGVKLKRNVLEVIIGSFIRENYQFICHTLPVITINATNDFCNIPQAHRESAINFVGGL